ncbi:Ribosomal protein arginine N-methyltransferase rmt3 [Neophaeococcomyces mojaviensis]|uniref:Ribosomal protein arginine N-methyltransferase rmt3 n=1 Tax=Neophaeococcomyces mojaviensis TaxID=3383035 RepID=A0ACC2ZVQ4_9EURO|nr:Ribosomal protein arginine N-methyltransferase rmt3 [Knufia sp. JES_112]
MATLQERVIDSLPLSSDDDDDDAEETWEDVDDEAVPDVFISLFDKRTFEDVNDMFTYCKDQYGFDIWHLQQQHDLDFLGLVKLVNFVRKSVSQGKSSPDVSSKALFDDDIYLLPAMESDTVLYNLEDILVQARTVAQTQIEELQEQMAALQARFDAYKVDVAKYLGHQLEEDQAGSSSKDEQLMEHKKQKFKDEADADYFLSYSFNAIHESMLKDKIRTDAYRDFIYDNKDLFRDKVVLDVGCGTGILSMFCAKAGAKQVISVDNSDIINNAREIIKANALDDRIQCIRGKIEDVDLPVKQVDVIVSEWMGYCLLYESMLDSVIHARDKYLAPDGLMVPSHATLRIAPLADSELRFSHLDFWNDVYGFDMKTMLQRAHEECLIKSVYPEELAGEGTVFKVLDLHKVSVQDLEFKSSYTVNTTRASGNLEGFLIWFDIFFTRSRDTTVEDCSVEEAKKRGITAFSTGPFSEQTHWQQGVCFVKAADQELVNGSTIKGEVTFRKAAKDARGLKIKVNWQLSDSEAREQSWRIE